MLSLKLFAAFSLSNLSQVFTGNNREMSTNNNFSNRLNSNKMTDLIQLIFALANKITGTALEMLLKYLS